MGTPDTDGSAPKSIPELSPEPNKPEPKPTENATEVVDSWEDEELSSGPDEVSPKRNTPRGLPPSAPPPTPSSPFSASRPWSPMRTNFESQPLPQPLEPAGALPRPEKTDAVARRMIAGALGLKVSKRNEEQEAYEKAIREKETKRREQEKNAEKKRLEETEQARAAVWND